MIRSDAKDRESIRDGCEACAVGMRKGPTSTPPTFKLTAVVCELRKADLSNGMHPDRISRQRARARRQCLNGRDTPQKAAERVLTSGSRCL